MSSIVSEVRARRMDFVVNSTFAHPFFVRADVEEICIIYSTGRVVLV